MRDISGGKEHSMTGLTGRFLVKGRAVAAAVLWNRFMYYLLWLMLFWKPFFWSANTNGDLIWSNSCRISMDQTAEQVLTFVKVYLASSCARVGRSFIERGFGGTGPQSCPKKSQQKPHPVKCKRDYKRKTYLYTTVYLVCCFWCLSCCAHYPRALEHAMVWTFFLGKSGWQNAVLGWAPNNGMCSFWMWAPNQESKHLAWIFGVWTSFLWLLHLVAPKMFQPQIVVFGFRMFAKV